MQLPGSYHISQNFRNPNLALQPQREVSFYVIMISLSQKTKQNKKPALACTVSAITTHV